MRESLGLRWYTLDELVDLTGYQKGTLYNLTVEGIISKPILGLAGADYPSQGLYKEQVLKEIELYKSLRRSGMHRTDIIAHLNTERESYEQYEFPILETRG
jgi:hypothetical protein